MAPSQCFELLLEPIELETSFTEIYSLLGYGKTVTVSDLELENGIKDADIMLIGMSSSPLFAEIEVRAALMAIKLGVPFGFYADVPLCPMRARPGAWFHEVAKQASLLTGLLPADTTETMVLFPKAEVRKTGNPIRDSMAFPRFTRAQVREKFGIADDEIFVLAPGGKFMVGNAIVWSLLAEAVAEFNGKVCIGYTPHPGDKTIQAVDPVSRKPLELYEESLPHLASGKVRVNFFERDFIHMLDAVAGADVVVEFTGSGSVAAAYQRIPVVNVLPTVWMRQFTEESGSPIIETVAAHASIPVDQMNPAVLARAIWRALDNKDVRYTLRDAQERAYPQPASPTGSRDLLIEVLKYFCS